MGQQTNKLKSASEKKWSGSQKSIFVIDDELNILNFICNVLEDSGYSVQKASKGNDAIKMILKSSENPDLILTDVIMPDINGKEMITKLKQKCVNSEIIYMSGNPYDHLGKDGVLDTNINFIQKPFSIESLLNLIQKVLDK